MHHLLETGTFLLIAGDAPIRINADKFIGWVVAEKVTVVAGLVFQ